MMPMATILTIDDKRCAKLKRVRSEIEAVEAEIAALDHGWLSVDEAVAGIMAATAAPLREMENSIRQRCQPGAHGPLVPMPLLAGGGELPVMAHGGVDALSVARFTMGESAFEAMLRERIMAFHPDAGEAIALADRPARRAELVERRERLRDDEEHEHAVLERQNLFVVRPLIADNDDAAIRRFVNGLGQSV